MENKKLGAVERQFAELIWQGEPISSGELVRLCGETLGWKKSTTYTVLKKLCERGIFANQNGIVTSLVSRDKFFSIQSVRAVDEDFGGSLPAFIAAFASSKPLTEGEIEEIRRLIDSAGEN